MFKPTKRKGFSFLRSYFDALNEIPTEKDKLDFLLSIINKQFLDEDPKDLDLIAKLSYQGQRHAIEKSVKGYKDKTKMDLLGNPIEDPTQGGSQGGYEHPSQQEKEEEQEEVQEEDEVKDEAIRSIKEIVIDYKNNDRLINALLTSKEKLFSSNLDINQKLDTFVDSLKLQDITTKRSLDFNKHFLNWVRFKKQLQQKNQSTSTLKQTPIER